MDQAVMTGGFSDPSIQSAWGFRAAMNAMARPGDILAVQGAQAPAPVSVAAAVLMLVLCDPETPVWLAPSHDSDALRRWIAFHTGAPVVAARGEAAFALGTWDSLVPLRDYRIGTPEYPDRSATLIVEMDELRTEGAVLTGPGIKQAAGLNLPDAAAFRANRGLYPLGLDFFLTCGDRLAALPRSTHVTTPSEVS
ncbi:MAG: phosphonate C-P lyase system protein PhnH [Paracoccaceae bacterium]|nr:phosphonate C-P lyase system protein PhnH [Paracoccaceae bacterium]